MKLNKFFMLGLAGLAFAACSNEEEVDNGLSGLSAVSIKIESSELTRAIADATQGDDGIDKVSVVPQANTEVVITLTADEGGGEFRLTPDQWNKGKVVTFWNVSNPTSVTVSMNGGVASYNAINIATGSPSLQVLPAAIPVYGSTSTFTPTDRSESPDADDDHQTGATSDDESKTYQIYTATVQLDIPVARLEVSGIKHVTHTNTGDDKCLYSKLTIAGVYMDNVKPTDGGTRTDYQFSASGTGSGAEAILKDAITDNTDFLDDSKVWPATATPAKAYAYNFYGPTAAEIADAEQVTDNAETDDVDEALEAKQALNPKFKIYFSEAEGVEGGKPVTEPRYAMITNYKDKSGNSIILKNGTIYRITEAVLKDSNIIGDETGNTLIGVEVTVVEAKWDVKTIEADWAE